MDFFKYKKQIIWGVLIFLFICILNLLIFFFISSRKTTAVSSSNIINTVINEDIDLENTVNISDTAEEEIPEIVSDEKVSKEELKKEKVTKKDVQKSTATYYIKVNYKANTVTIYDSVNFFREILFKNLIPSKLLLFIILTYCFVF